MIPEAGRDFINLTLDQARRADDDALAEKFLASADTMLSYAMVCGQIEPREHSAWVAMIALVRAEREDRASARS